jgi:H+/Cl- antiporter ClcA
MKRAIVILFLAALGVLYLYSAFGPNRPRRQRPVPFKIASVRRVIHAFLGIVLLLGVLLLIYGAFLSLTAED